MTKHVLIPIAVLGVLLSQSGFAADGVTLIDQSTVKSAGGFPYVISKPGHYRLTSSLTVTGPVDGIDVTVDDVKIDLNGFTISGGPASSTGALPSGIAATSSVRFVDVHGGFIESFDYGVQFQSCIGCSIDSTRISARSYGILAGTADSVTGNIVSLSNAFVGIVGAAGSSVAANVVLSANGTSGAGIEVNCPVNVSGNTIQGVYLNPGLLFQGSGCIASNNLSP